LPDWLWAQTYEHNIVGELIAPPGVYPTPIYETAMALLLFALLWRLRGHGFRRGWLFALYLVLAGAERLVIERIRVNPVLHLLGVQATQAQMVAAAFVAVGAVALLGLSRPRPAVRREAA
jgi:phosphatidylglycerol:prolipoprotein diacylglycerol transferase